MYTERFGTHCVLYYMNVQCNYYILDQFIYNNNIDEKF